MKLITLPLTIALLLVRVHLAFTERRLRAQPLTVALAANFKAALSNWWGVLQSELDIEDEVNDATVETVSVDAELNIFCQRLSNAILLLTNNERTSDLYIHYFRNKTLSAFNKPILGAQLEAAEGWISSLSQSEHPSLKALGDELPDLIKRAKDAALAKKAALKKRDDFREVGDRKKFIDAVNTLRKETYGTLSTMPHNNVGLPSNFADQFFRSDRVKAEDPTPESLAEEINALKEQLQAKEQEHAALVEARDKELAEAEALAKTRAETKAKLATIEMELVAKKKEVAALKATLGSNS